MEAKKTESADLKRKGGLYFNAGLFLSMLLVVFAFEWRNYDDSGVVDLGQVNDDFEDLMEIPPTEQPPPPPPKIQQPEIIEVPDEEEIEEEIEVDLDVEITEDEVIEDIIIEEAPEEEEVQEIFTIVEDPAMPQGGYQAFYDFVAKKLKYPAQARRMGIEGKVYVEFIVDRDGSLTNVRSIKGIGAGCDEEAVRVIQSAPKWSPPKQRGQPVKQKIVLPITFKLG